MHYFEDAPDYEEIPQNFIQALDDKKFASLSPMPHAF